MWHMIARGINIGIDSCLQANRLTGIWGIKLKKKYQVISQEDVCMIKLFLNMVLYKIACKNGILI